MVFPDPQYSRGQADGQQQIRRTESFHADALLIWRLASSMVSHFQNRNLGGGKAEGPREVLTYQLLTNPSDSGKIHSPEWKQGRGETDFSQLKKNGSLPSAVSHRSFSTASSQLSNPMKALVCCVPSLYGFCNKSVNPC